MAAQTNKPQSFAWKPIWVPQGSLRDSWARVVDGVESNFNNVQTSIRQIVGRLAADEADTGAALAAKSPLNSPKFTGFVGLPILTAIPADPADGESQIFIYNNAGSLSLYVRAKTTDSPDVQFSEVAMAAEP